MKKILFLSALFFGITPLFYAQDTLNLDQTFGTGGTAQFGLPTESAFAAFERTDGKIVVITKRTSNDSSFVKAYVLNPNGLNDNTFNGGNGTATIHLNFGFGNSTPFDASILPDNDLLVSTTSRVLRLDADLGYDLIPSWGTNGDGTSTFAFWPYRLRNVKYFRDLDMISVTGEKNATFNSNSDILDANTGLIIDQMITQWTDANPFNDDVSATDCIVNDSLMFQLGNIDVSGGLSPGNYYAIHVKNRMGSSVTIDTTYLILETGADFSNRKIQGQVLSDGSILLIMYNFAYDVHGDIIRTMKLNADGSLNSTFGLQTVFDFPNPSDIWDLCLNTDLSGKSYLSTYSGNKDRVFKFDTNSGNLDNTFGTDGILELQGAVLDQTKVSVMDNGSLLQATGNYNGINEAGKIYKWIDPASLSLLSTSELDFDIYPNPTNGLIHLKSNNTIGTLKLVDFSGKTLFEKTVNESSTMIDLTTLSPGVYFLHLGEQINKIVKQ